jgi:hypothetical protein
LVTHGVHIRTHDRIAGVVGYPTGDDAASRQRKINLFGDLCLGEIQRPSTVERPLLSELEPDVPGFADRNRVPACREILEFVPALSISTCEAVCPEACRNSAHLRPAQWGASVRCDDAAADLRCACRRFRRCRLWEGDGRDEKDCDC